MLLKAGRGGLNGNYMALDYIQIFEETCGAHALLRAFVVDVGLLAH